MKAQLVHYVKRLYTNDIVLEIVIWKLADVDKYDQHGYQYRLHYGKLDGTCIVRYDNKKSKGDHKHIYDREQPYFFTTVTQLIYDFLSDVARTRHKNDDKTITNCR